MHIILAGALLGGVVLLLWLVEFFYEAEEKPVRHIVTRDNLLPIWKVDAKSGASCQCLLTKLLPGMLLGVKALTQHAEP